MHRWRIYSMFEDLYGRFKRRDIYYLPIANITRNRRKGRSLGEDPEVRADGQYKYSRTGHPVIDRQDDLEAILDLGIRWQQHRSIWSRSYDRTLQFYTGVTRLSKRRVRDSDRSPNMEPDVPKPVRDSATTFQSLFQPILKPRVTVGFLSGMAPLTVYKSKKFKQVTIQVHTSPYTGDGSAP